MMQRVWQFFQALRARLSPADRLFVEEHLPLQLQTMFWGMTLPDQCHALRVARTALELAQREGPAGLDRELLLRGGLLHDIGRQQGDMGTLGKVFAVLCYGMFPQLSRQWAAAGQGCILASLRRALYIYAQHPEIGAQRLRQA